MSRIPMYTCTKKYLILLERTKNLEHLFLQGTHWRRRREPDNDKDSDQGYSISVSCSAKLVTKNEVELTSVSYRVNLISIWCRTKLITKNEVDATSVSYRVNLILLQFHVFAARAIAALAAKTWNWRILSVCCSLLTAAHFIWSDTFWHTIILYPMYVAK